MAEQHDLPSNSDDSDEDFKPSDAESLPSEEDSDGSVEEPGLDTDQPNSAVGKRKKKQTKRRKKIKKSSGEVEAESDDEDEKRNVKTLSAEEEKQKADSLWSDFMKDCAAPATKKTPSNSLGEAAATKDVKSIPNKSPATEKENKTVVTEVFEFAGEKIKVPVVVPVAGVRGRGGRARGGGLAALVGQLGKKNKLSTLEKSKLDWDRFKKDEGIEQDLQVYNKGKEGYLERQDFLQRTDLRQFEIEKQLRSTSRSNR